MPQDSWDFMATWVCYLYLTVQVIIPASTEMFTRIEGKHAFFNMLNVYIVYTQV